MTDDRLRAYDDITTRIWRDKRATPGTRELLLALAWIVERDPDAAAIPRRERGRYLWQQVRAMTGDEYGQPRYKQLVADDAPRYEPPNTWPHRACQAPRIRPYKPRTPDTAGRCLLPHHPHLGACRYTIVYASPGTPTEPPAPTTCGAPPKWDYHLVEKDPRTGWHIDHYFCTRHKDHAARVRAQVEAAGPAPEPIPTTGGLLPCYFKADFERLYRDETQRLHLQWEPPVYGLCADDWPLPGRDSALPRRAGLRLVVSELADA